MNEINELINKVIEELNKHETQGAYNAQGYLIMAQKQLSTNSEKVSDKLRAA